MPTTIPFHVECTGSRPITDVEQHWAWLVLGWETMGTPGVVGFF